MRPKLPKKLHTATQAVRAGTLRSAFGEHSEAIYLTSSFVFDCAQSAADKFADRFGEDDSPYVYSRYDNPNTEMLESRLAAIEGAQSAIVFSSGLAAHLAIAMTFMRAGDEMVSSRDIFGSTHKLFDHWLERFALKTHFVPVEDLEAWERAINPRTKILYVETPSNPLNRLADLPALAQLAKKHGLMLVVDNTFSTSLVQKPLDFGADLVTYSATKFFDGQGRALAGAVLGSESHIKELRLFLRSVGPCLSPFNAWLIFKGLETLPLRVERQCANALYLAKQLQNHPAVAQVSYPFLPNHPQFSLAKSQMLAGGTIISFFLHPRNGDAQKTAWQVIDRVTLFNRTANLGDTRSMITHPATTTHGRLNAEQQSAMGITPAMVRLAMGLEDREDLWNDLSAALSAD